jgi:hypothetical protein
MSGPMTCVTLYITHITTGMVREGDCPRTVRRYVKGNWDGKESEKIQGKNTDGEVAYELCKNFDGDSKSTKEDLRVYWQAQIKKLES